MRTDQCINHDPIDCKAQELIQTGLMATTTVYGGGRGGGQGCIELNFGRGRENVGLGGGLV